MYRVWESPPPHGLEDWRTAEIDLDEPLYDLIRLKARADGLTINQAIHGLLGEALGAAFDLGVYPTTLTTIERGAIIGFEDGTLGVRTAHGVRRVSLEQAPKRAVSALSEGPMGTVVVGYHDGVAGLWSLENGARLERLRLHGPIVSIALRDGHLHAESELGQSAVRDLSMLRAAYCDVMRAMWAESPASWAGGLPRVTPPPHGHLCLK